jgi:hypothetical protein
MKLDLLVRAGRNHATLTPDRLTLMNGTPPAALSEIFRQCVEFQRIFALNTGFQRAVIARFSEVRISIYGVETEGPAINAQISRC